MTRPPRATTIAALIACLLLTASTPTLAAGSSTGEPQAGPDINEGVFKIRCNFARHGEFDPLLYPGVQHPEGAHWHDFFGNDDVDWNSDPDDLRGNSTATNCPEKEETNKSAYWTPRLRVYDLDKNGPDQGGMRWAEPGFTMNYYRDGGIIPSGLQIEPFDPQHSMIAGDAHAMVQEEGVVEWTCTRGEEDEDPGRLTIEKALLQVDTRLDQDPGTATTCPLDDGDDGHEYTGVLKLRIFFPNCWDGNNTTYPWNGDDGPNDYTSNHMTYSELIPLSDPPEKACPPEFPRELPALMINSHWAGADRFDLTQSFLASDIDPEEEGVKWRGGSAHADFMNGWNTAMLTGLVNECLNEPQDDCADAFIPECWETDDCLDTRATGPSRSGRRAEW